VCLCLIQGIACDSHESLLLLVHGSGGGLSRGHGVVLLPLGSGGGGGGMLPVDGGEVGVAAWHSRQDDGGGWR
jgi:hypothetical protein